MSILRWMTYKIPVQQTNDQTVSTIRRRSSLQAIPPQCTVLRSSLAVAAHGTPGPSHWRSVLLVVVVRVMQ